MEKLFIHETSSSYYEDLRIAVAMRAVLETTFGIKYINLLKLDDRTF